MLGYTYTCLLSFECPWWHYIHSVWSIKWAYTGNLFHDPALKIEKKPAAKKRNLTLLPPQKPASWDLWCVPTCLPRVSHLSPSWHEALQFVYANISCLPASPWHWESLLPLQWLVTGEGQHHVSWVRQGVTTHGQCFLWLVLALKKLSETFLELHIGETEVMHVLNQWAWTCGHIWPYGWPLGMLCL